MLQVVWWSDPHYKIFVLEYILDMFGDVEGCMMKWSTLWNRCSWTSYYMFDDVLCDNVLSLNNFSLFWRFILSLGEIEFLVHSGESQTLKPQDHRSRLSNSNITYDKISLQGNWWPVPVFMVKQKRQAGLTVISVVQSPTTQVFCSVVIINIVNLDNTRTYTSVLSQCLCTRWNIILY